MNGVIKFFEEHTNTKYNDLPEGIQTVSSTLTIKLMKLYHESKSKGTLSKD